MSHLNDPHQLHRVIEAKSSLNQDEFSALSKTLKSELPSLHLELMRLLNSSADRSDPVRPRVCGNTETAMLADKILQCDETKTAKGTF